MDKTRSSDREVRVRFAPSPTGELHVGGVRAALFNWLFAKHCGGKFLLRIEDTDRVRSTPEAIRAIIDGLAWLGLESDEEIVYQSDRIDRHRDAAYQLLRDGLAYRDFTDPEAVAKMREDSQRRGQGMWFDRRVVKPSAEEENALLAQGKPFAIRLLIPEGEVVYTDGVHGELRVANSEIEDFVILRRDGSPTYMHAVVVDDADMGITHIIRGNDHITNTPKQILLYRALGKPEPQFAHVPLILGQDKKPLSKRQGATSVAEYRAKGYLPDALIAYLGLLGWSPGDDRNDITRRELIELFAISGIIPSASAFDEAKLRWLNGHYISRTVYEQVAGELDRFAADAVHTGKLKEKPAEAAVFTAWELSKNRLHTLRDLFEDYRYLFQDPTEYEPKGVRKQFLDENVWHRLRAIAADFETLVEFDAAAIEGVIRARADEWGVSTGSLIHPLRLAVSGVTGGPSLFDMLAGLGRQAVLRRIANAEHEFD